MILSGIDATFHKVSEKKCVRSSEFKLHKIKLKEKNE